MVNKDLYFIPISSCLVTSGFYRASVMNFHHRELNFIPNILNRIMIKNKHWKVADILDHYPEEYKETITEYLNYLEENRYAYFGEKHEITLFPDMIMEWDFPSFVTNAIVDIKDLSLLNYFNIIDQLDNVDCSHLQLRLYDSVSDKGKIIELLEYADKKSFHTLGVVIDYNVFGNKESYTELVKNIKRIDHIIVYSSPESGKEIFNYECAFISYSTNKFDVTETCGYVDVEYFSLNIEHFTESLQYNTCLNRKICIDADGFIKNCPSLKPTFGRISDTTLAEAMEKPGFKGLWNIRKDQIDVCRDCEFRHICTDCRVFIRDYEDIYSQPAKCGYNPYIGKWEEEAEWISVEQWRSENPNWENEAMENRELG